MCLATITYVRAAALVKPRWAWKMPLIKGSWSMCTCLHYVFIPSLNWLPASRLHITCELKYLQSCKMLPKGVLDLLSALHDPRPSAPPKLRNYYLQSTKNVFWEWDYRMPSLGLPFIGPTGKMWSEDRLKGARLFTACSSGHLTKCTCLIPRSSHWQDLDRFTVYF